jgi:hypothetical protein
MELLGERSLSLADLRVPGLVLAERQKFQIRDHVVQLRRNFVRNDVIDTSYVSGARPFQHDR